MNRVSLLVFHALLVFLLGGCVIARRVSFPTEEKLNVQGRNSANCTIRVDSQSGTNYFTVASDGRLAVAVPGMGPGCTMYLFGVRAFVLNDESPYSWRVIHVMRGTEILRSLSLKELAHLHQDADGYRVVKVQ